MNYLGLTTKKEYLRYARTDPRSWGVRLTSITVCFTNCLRSYRRRGASPLVKNSRKGGKIVDFSLGLSILLVALTTPKIN